MDSQQKYDIKKQKNLLLLFNSKYILCFYLQLTLVIVTVKSQNFNSLYQINILEHEIEYYKNSENYVCALSLIRSSDSTILNEINPLLIADIFLYNNDTVGFKEQFNRFVNTINDYKTLEETILNNKQYSFLTEKIPEYLKIVYYNRAKVQKQLDFDLQIQQMFRGDYFIRKHRDQITQSLFQSTDSANKIDLTNIFLKDSFCSCVSNEYIITLLIHLSRYDTSTFIAISKYVFRCYPKSMSSGIFAFLADNRTEILYKTQTYYSYLFTKNAYKINNIKEVDDRRRLIGLEPLFYSYSINKMKIPDYYKELIKHYCDQ